MTPHSLDMTEMMDLANQYYASGRTDEAANLCDQILAAGPKHLDALHLRGVISHQRGEHRAAVTFLSKASEQDPLAGAVLNNLGLAHLTLNELEHAAECFRRAIAIESDDVDVRMNLVRVLVARGHTDEVIANLHQVLSARPSRRKRSSSSARRIRRRAGRVRHSPHIKSRSCCGPTCRSPRYAWG